METILTFCGKGLMEAPEKPKKIPSIESDYPGLTFKDQLFWYKMIYSTFDDELPFIPADGQAIYDCSDVYDFPACYFLHLLLSDEREEVVESQFVGLEEKLKSKAVPIFREMRRTMIEMNKSIPKSSEETINALSWIPMIFERFDSVNSEGKLKFQPVKRNSVVKSVIGPEYDFEAQYHSDRIIIADDSFLKNKDKFKKFLCGVSQYNRTIYQDVMGLIVKGSEIYVVKSGERFQIFGKLDATNSMDMAFLCTVMLYLYVYQELWPLNCCYSDLLRNHKKKLKKKKQEMGKEHEINERKKSNAINKTRPSWK